MKKRNVLNSPRLRELKKQRQKVLFVKILLSTLVIVIFFAGLAYISRISHLNISLVEVAGNKVIETEVIQKFVESQITGKYLWLFPKTNILYYPKSKMEAELENKFKRLKDIKFSIRGIEDDESNLYYLQVNISERTAKYLWCETEEKCYFMDENGFIFDEAPYFSGEVYFKFYGPRDGDFAKLFPFKKTTEDMGLKPTGLLILENDDVEMFLSGKSKPKIIFKASSDFQKISENLQAALATEPLQSDFKNKYSSLLYLDLRYGNKVYYKFR